MSYSSYHPQEALLAQFSLYVHKGSLKSHLYISFSVNPEGRRNVPIYRACPCYLMWPLCDKVRSKTIYSLNMKWTFLREAGHFRLVDVTL